MFVSIVLNNLTEITLGIILKFELINGVKNNIVEIYDNRNILKSLVRKELFGRYKNSLLGFLWNFLSPTILLIMYFVVFTEIRNVESIENAWVFIGVAIFTFNFMVSCITGGTSVFINNATLMKKMYFPKEILVLSRTISSMIVCMIGNTIVIIAMILTSYEIVWYYVLYMLPILVLVFIFGVGCIFLLSSLTVYIRDIQFVLGPMSIALFMLTPMRYMADQATGLVRDIIWYNPLTYYVEIIHDILYWGISPNPAYMIMCVLLSASIFCIGYIVFLKLKSGFIKRL